MPVCIEKCMIVLSGFLIAYIRCTVFSKLSFDDANGGELLGNEASLRPSLRPPNPNAEVELNFLCWRLRLIRVT